MDKRIRSMIDALFSQMKMTADNLALRDEMIANALARYEDNLAQGKSGEEAFEEVAASLGDVQAMLEEMCAVGDAAEEPEACGEEACGEEEETRGGSQTDLGDMLGKAFSALGDFGQTIMPEAKKFVEQMDDASGGMLRRIGEATKKGLRSAQKAAEEAIDRLSGEAGELVFDFGAKGKRETQEPKAETYTADDVIIVPPAEEAQGEEKIKAEIEIEIGNETESADEASEAVIIEASAEEMQHPQPLVDENGDVDEAALAEAALEIAREAEAVILAVEAAAQAEDGGE